MNKLNETQGVAAYPYRIFIDDLIEATKIWIENKNLGVPIKLSDFDDYEIPRIRNLYYRLYIEPRKKKNDISAACGFVDAIEGVDNYILTPYLITLVLPNEWADYMLRAILYHEFNHMIELSIAVFKNRYINNLINYQLVSDAYDMIADHITEKIGDIKQKFNLDLTITSIGELKKLLKILYRWYSDTEFNAFIAEFYGKLSKYLPKRISFSEIENDEELFKDINAFYDFKDILENKEYVIRNIKPFFDYHIDTDDVFYKWIVKAQEERYNKLIKKLKKAVDLYNITLQQAEEDEKKYEKYNERKRKLKENIYFHPDIYCGEFLTEMIKRLEESR